jgi:hypothetical protein
MPDFDNPQSPAGNVPVEGNTPSEPTFEEPDTAPSAETAQMDMLSAQAEISADLVAL